MKGRELSTCRAALTLSPGGAASSHHGSARGSLYDGSGQVGELEGCASFGVAPPDARPADRHVLELATRQRKAKGEASQLDSPPPLDTFSRSNGRGMAAEQVESPSELFTEFKQSEGAEVRL